MMMMTTDEAGEMRRSVLDLMRDPGYQPVTTRDLLQLLGIPKESRGAFRRMLRSLVRDEKVVRVEGKRLAIRDPGAEDQRRGRKRPLVVGRLQISRRGYGFVTPDEGGGDILVPRRSVGELMNDDRVEVAILRRDSRGRAVGRVVGLVERSRRRLLGIFHAPRVGEGPGTVAPYERRFNSDIIVPREGRGTALDGQVVGIELLPPVGDGRGPSGKVVEVLGFPDEPGMDLRTIVRKYDLRTEFPPDVLQAAAVIPPEVPAEEIGRREDFRHLPIVTIDGETAMDFDDAVHVERLADGGYELQVHIADVSHYVTPSGPLDQEAYERGTSVYFPGTAIPMLPHELSNGICSLNPGVDRLVQSCVMKIDRHGEVVSYRIAQGVIRSAARMTYTNVARILVDDDREVTKRYEELVPGFKLMEELCGVLNAKRERRGSIDFDLPEPEVVLAATGEMTGIVALERNVAHRLIEEFMLAANETVARHLWRARVPSLYRVHERPDPRRLEEFNTVSQALGYRLAGPYHSIEPGAFQAIVEMAKGMPEERLLSRLMLRAMKQARYAEKRDRHFGLACTCYTHFTSPIRRYPDLVVHRLLKRSLTAEPLRKREREALEGFLPEAALRSSRTERNAAAAENELIEWKKMAFMGERLGEEFEGWIVSMHRFGLFVELREFFVEGLVPVETLQDDSYRFVERKQVMVGERHGGTFQLGQKVRVRVDRVNHFQLQIDFSLVEPSASAAGTGRRPRKTRGRLRPRSRR